MKTRCWSVIAVFFAFIFSFYFVRTQTLPTVLYIEKFSTDASMTDSEKKKERIEEIPDSKLVQIQEAIWSETKKSQMFSEVIILKDGEKPTIEENKECWVLSGYFLDYKKGNQAVRYLVGFGAGKQKIEVQVELKNAKSGETIRTERIVDRKVGGFFGGNAEKGLKDFAERIVQFLKEVKGT